MVRTAFLVLGVAICGTAIGYDPSWPGPRDFPLLPPYCKARLDKSATEADKAAWHGRLGEDFGMVVHHYCAGLNFFRRASLPSKDQTDKPNLLIQAVTEFSYAITHGSPRFVLLPEVLVNRGRAFAGLGKTGEAIGDFMRAIEVRPDWPGSYLALSNFYAERGMIQDARKVLNDGIERSPNSEVLRKQLAALDKKG